uniref:Ig-like domain-containing protein n=1 Tax=Sparus aurata TaxID=8175 RepID=A0A671X0R7_SPAAU
MQRCETKVLKYNYYNVDQSASQRKLQTDTNRHIKVIKVESQWFCGATVVTQKPPVVTLRRGETATMDCNLGTVTDSYAWWYKQIPGGVPQFVLCFHHSWGSIHYGSGTKLIVTSNLPPPVLTLFPPSSAELQSNKASLVCLSSQSVPFADVSWLAGGSPVSSGISTSTAVQQPDQTFQISSFLAIQTSDWNMEKVYTCKVSLGSQTAEKNINKSDCRTEE